MFSIFNLHDHAASESQGMYKLNNGAFYAVIYDERNVSIHF